MFRKIGLIIAAILPFSGLRHLWYRVFFGYRISGRSKIGMFNYLDCRELHLNDAHIGSFNLVLARKLVLAPGAYIKSRNRIKHLNQVSLQEKAYIFKGNFMGGPVSGEPGFVFEEQNLFLGKESAVNRHNYFDLVRAITIGNNVVFGGEGSEIWTHGYDTDRTLLSGGVTFGNDIFIGSRCIFTKGVQVADQVTIGPGSVVYKPITEKGLYSTHQLVKIR
jgi:acetyltransferase-like isoleucine patch superfamily enzyme